MEEGGTRLEEVPEMWQIESSPNFRGSSQRPEFQAVTQICRWDVPNHQISLSHLQNQGGKPEPVRVRAKDAEESASQPSDPKDVSGPQMKKPWVSTSLSSLPLVIVKAQPHLPGDDFDQIIGIENLDTGSENRGEYLTPGLSFFQNIYLFIFGRARS